MAKPTVMIGVRKRKFQQAQKDAVTKKQHVHAATITAMDVINKLLAPGGDVGYEVTDGEWEHLVQLTQKHALFERNFCFPENVPGWVSTSSQKKKSHFKVVAIDCEMCVTRPEGSRERMSNALCRVSAVDGENMLRNIISDFLIHQPEPGYHMVDTKTDIHGITPEQIAGCKITMAQAQKKMLKYINEDTIVVGHSVHGDLTSMRIRHRRVIDTALIFQRKGENSTRATPGLKDLTKFLLGFDMPQGHDSTVDAQASMLAAKYAARHQTGSIIPSAVELHGPRVKEPRQVLTRSSNFLKMTEYTGPAMLIASAYQPKHATGAIELAANVASHIDMAANNTDDTNKFKEIVARSCRLRVHRIPKGLSSKDIEKWFLENTNIVPLIVEQIAWLPNQNRGSCNVTFSTNAHAALAFESASGPNGKSKITLDSIGRPQKTIAIVSYMGTTFKNVVLGVQ
ncbi:small rna degrading nuclease 2 [Plasmopara halstedii]|uniref:Small rna degrading nuclease 2 n=1 Tax=Plasmopara halstedii TaxID=4781 RepID=A0A0P1B567_PLAHL|nr:small rna degrading nuclease 2 [Plasmopara halstedii]CEG49545.1 small rna degrading nuclease 2 [Plasmopara halstedii]|eukprot:XP_024585914.1 small rna degrading nuclease 2 [Plasmopara halstedii]